ncbi:uncharacterized protein F4822DRAFT_426440 [Hypoxylon trugodes]|uniref:uncharacterized protein n=1 Tax=Hypoxylon trugodes TaxID=326681 RepID=UPI0021940660|nr:uncharacterized protein F4822DRAFT_426440 [Hypoxylon trugodes]KAI1390592.1 hypothetical protein F4822DRAFT_426440 [Hypoxylon trugodes]
MSVEIPPGANLSQTPLLPNPDGSAPNFVDPRSLETETYSVIIILVIISFIIVSFRIPTHLKIYKRLALDDSTPTARHIWDVPLSAIDASWVKRRAILRTIYGPAMWFAKTAILTMYLRLFGVKMWMRWCCYFGIGVLFCAYWSLVPVSVIYNFPHNDEHWDLALMVESQPAQIPFVIMGFVDIVSDLYILALPFPVLLKLQTTQRKKVGLFLVFLTAIIGVVSSCFVFYFRVVLWRNETKDSTWNVAVSYLTVAVELNVAVIVSCTPATAAGWKVSLRKSKLLSSLRSSIGNFGDLLDWSNGKDENLIPNTGIAEQFALSGFYTKV